MILCYSPGLLLTILLYVGQLLQSDSVAQRRQQLHLQQA